MRRKHEWKKVREGPSKLYLAQWECERCGATWISGDGAPTITKQLEDQGAQDCDARTVKKILES